jgi:hypothetical protein
MEWQKKYAWRRTWPGEGHEDWSAFDGKIQIGRIMRDLATHNHRGLFMWSGGLSGVKDFRKRLMPHLGWVEEHWQETKAVEDWYDAMKAERDRFALASVYTFISLSTSSGSGSSA